MPRIDGLLQPFDDEAKTDPALGFVTELAFRVPVLKPKGTIITEAATTQSHHAQGVFAGSSPLHAITGHVATAKPAEALLFPARLPSGPWHSGTSHEETVRGRHVRNPRSGHRSRRPCPTARGWVGLRGAWEWCSVPASGRTSGLLGT